MANNDILGIQATINGADVQRGANQFISQVSRMENVSDKFINSLSQNMKIANGQIMSMGSSFASVSDTIVSKLGMIGVAFSAQQFAQKAMMIRGEFQQLEIAFTTMLGSADKANELMNQLINTAAKTPFDLKGVANGAKQLLAYGVASDKVNETLVRLGDISAGLSIPLNDMVYLYGTTMTQGRLFTQDLRQFMGRGIPLADELAKQFGVTKDKVGELVTAGRVGFPEVQKAIESMTNAGGKFGGLMSEQSKSITGQISNIQDALDMMFNEIGKSSEGVINKGLEGVSYLVDHWRQVGEAIGVAAAAYGTYKAAEMTTAAISNLGQAYNEAELIKGYESLLAVQQESIDADLAEAVSKGRLSQESAVQVAALRQEVSDRMKVLAAQKAQALAEEDVAFKAYQSALERKNSAESQWESIQNQLDAFDELKDSQHAAYLQTELGTAIENYNTASVELNTARQNWNTAATRARTAATSADTFAERANTVATNAHTASVGLLRGAYLQLITIMKSAWATMMANPLGIVVAAVTALGYAVYKYATRESEAEKATQKHNERLEENAKKSDELKKKTEDLTNAISDTNKSDATRNENFQKLKMLYPDILANINSEVEFLAKKKELLDQINDAQEKNTQKGDEELLQEYEQKLRYYQRVRRSGTSTTLVDMDGNGIATDNVEDAINAMQSLVNQQKARVAQYDVSKFVGGIKNMSKEDIQAAIGDANVMLKSIANLDKNAIALYSTMGKEISKEQLTMIQSSLNSELNSRNGVQKSVAEWVKFYKEEYEKAQKELDNFTKNKGAMSQEEFQRKYDDLRLKADAAKDTYEKYSGRTMKEEDKEGQELEKYKLLVDKQAREKKRSEEDAQLAIDEAWVSMQEDSLQKRLNILGLNYDKQMMQLERQQEDELIKLIDEERAKFEANPSNKGKVFNATGIELSDMQIEKFNMMRKQLMDAFLKQNDDIKKQQETSMRQYLMNYGTYEQKRLATTKEYEEKIKKARADGDEGAALSLQKQMQEELSQIDMAQLKESINWELVFSDLSKQSKKSLKDIQNQLKQFKNSKEYKDMSVEQKKVIDEALYNIQQNLIDKGGLLGDLPNQLQLLAGAQGELAKAQEEYDKALKDGTDEQKAAAKKRLNQAQNNVQNQSGNVELSKNKTVDNLLAINDALLTLGSGSEMSLAQFGSAVGSLVQVFASSGSKIGAIISGVLELLDMIGQKGLDGLIGNVFESLYHATGGILDSVGSVFGIKGLGGIYKGADYTNYNKMKDEYDNLIKVWDTLIQRKQQYIDISYGDEARKVGQEAIDLYNKQIDSARSLGIERLNSGASAGSHSIGVRIMKNMSQQGKDELQKAAKEIGFSYSKVTDGRMTGLFELSAEQLAKLREQAPTFWAKLDDDVREYLEQIIECNDNIEEMKEKLKEATTGVSFDSFYDSFVDRLMDMDKKSKDFADDFGEYLMKSILQSLVANKYRDQIQALYDAWYQYSDSNGDGNFDLTPEEKQQLQEQQRQLAEQMIAERDALAEVFGFKSSSYSQEASSKGFQSMSQDTGEELNGRFTALQIAGEEIKAQSIMQTEFVKYISQDTSAIKFQIAWNTKQISEMIDIQHESNEHLSAIQKNTNQLYEMNDRLDKIEKNTRNL